MDGQEKDKDELDIDLDEESKKQEDETSESDKSKKEKKAKGSKSGIWKIILILIITALLSAGATWWWMNKQSDKNSQKQKDQITDLQKQLEEKGKELEKAKKDLESAQSDQAPAEVQTLPTQATLDNIKAAVSSKNTAALEGYMASKVNVIMAASECCGVRTPTQAIADMKYLDSATDPWDWNLPAATLAKYRAGFYKQYFPANALIGKSTNGYVVSFSFDANGKINGVFMAINEDIL